MLAASVIAECLAIAADARRAGDLQSAFAWRMKARDWRQHGAAELVANRLHYLMHSVTMRGYGVTDAPLCARPLSAKDSTLLFWAADKAWSKALEAQYGHAGTKGYDRARYHTAPVFWATDVFAAWRVRDEARHAWMIACHMVSNYPAHLAPLKVAA